LWQILPGRRRLVLRPGGAARPLAKQLEISAVANHDVLAARPNQMKPTPFHFTEEAFVAAIFQNVRFFAPYNATFVDGTSTENISHPNTH
jgi:hypothetical protein